MSYRQYDVDVMDESIETPVKRWVYANYIDQPIIMETSANLYDPMQLITRYYYHRDHNFNVTHITDSSGNIVERYDYISATNSTTAGYGMVEIFTGPGPDWVWNTADDMVSSTSLIGNNFMFQGRWKDQSVDLYWFRARMLEAKTGKFMQRDPIGIWGDPNNLGNGYALEGGNPWNCLDPSGLRFVQSIRLNKAGKQKLLKAIGAAELAGNQKDSEYETIL